VGCWQNDTPKKDLRLPFSLLLSFGQAKESKKSFQEPKNSLQP
jgi:hypothetical protein